MSSNLKRAKVYFLVIACFVTCIVVLCSYKVGLTERIYKFQDTKLHFRIPILTSHMSIQNSSLSNIRSILTTGNQKYANVTLDIVKHISTINSSTTAHKRPSSTTSNSSANSPTLTNQGARQSAIKTLNDSSYHIKTKSYDHENTTLNVKPELGETGYDSDTESKNLKQTISDISAGQSDLQNANLKQHNSHDIESFKYSQLSHNLRSPDHFKSYLLKLGLSHHGIDQLGGTVRPDSCKNCFKNDFKLILNVPELCQGEVFLLIMISSTISNRGARDAIRDTWGNTCNKENSRIKCLFLLGISKGDTKNDMLFKESKQHNDIIQHVFIDTYANLTYKTLTAMRWVEQFCPDADFIMKTDDDMFVNTELLPTLLEAAPTEGFMGGICWGPSPPHRERQSKWYVSFQQYSRSTFPAMCSGTGYVMSGDVITGILQQSKNMPFFYLEDVYVALCLKKLSIKPVLLHGFHHTFAKIEPCNYKNRVITSHGPNKYDLYSIWEGIQKCEKEDLTPEMLYLPRSY